MSGLLNLTPTLRIVIENPLLGKSYPPTGELVAVVDTGYEGFLAVPREVFASLSLDELQQEKRTLILANGTALGSEGAYGTLRVPAVPLKADGLVETYEGLEEVLLGVEALSSSKVLLDYCSRRIKVERCP
jgi:clan AA aspartic protease